ncbi:MAG: N-acetyl-gamma-glutamyl-phosphate reductase [OM182 bacterium]|nr:N-acetyl-gamma-glutamyl-phosphate reductase [Gammaproteobacteria bacterium]MDB2375074.1 N-acetyl-gamma-glutamyl-phosphate reductase [Gammaproteobacteria bacterium]
MIKVGIVGATGYTGVELLRLLAPRDEVDIAVVTSRELEGTLVADLFPSLRGHIALSFSAPDIRVLGVCDVVFFATPHAVAMHTVPALLALGTRVIDLSADFRIKDIPTWESWYGGGHACPELVADAVYGLPEVNRDAILSARLIAVPGCYPTAIQLGFLPLLEGAMASLDRLIADAKSGVSGAGRKAAVGSLFSESADSIKAYGVEGHRHLPEIKQGLEAAAGAEVSLMFVPHLTPMVRGILATLYAPLKLGVEASNESLQQIYEARFANEPFVEVLPQGQLPATRDVRGSNRCEISVRYNDETHTAIVIAVEDNLVKGASGQAVQNMNIMFGLPETQGLCGIAVLP